MSEIDHTTFETEVREAGEQLSPARANLLLARECVYPDLRPSDYLITLDDLAEAARPRVRAESGSLAQGLALGAFLFQDQGFAGNRADYADPRNSYLNEVLDRRLGIPISLSALYLEVGWRLRLPVAGVGLPGHFIVQVAGEGGPAYLDPFNGGRQLSVADCADLVQRTAGAAYGFDAAWLMPTRPREIVARMLNNLRNLYITVEDWPLAIGVVERLGWLQPRNLAHVRDLAVLNYRQGSLRRAADLFGSYLQQAPEAGDVGPVRQALDLLLRELGRLN